LLQTNYANLVQSTQGGATNILRVIEPATVPTKPVGPSKYLIILIAGVIGLGLALAAVYLLEFLDDTIKSPDDVSKLVDLPVIGFLADLGKKFTEKPYVADNPRSMLAEAYRSLRASMEFNRQEHPYQVILVSSPEAGDGKTSVAVNLAVTMLHGGKNVLLVDADFRKPNVHNVLALPNKAGLCDVLNKELDLHKVVQKWDGLGLRVVTAGQSSEYLDELLQPERLQAVITQLREAADVVIIDSSPFLVSDAMAMLPFVDGTLLVIRPGHTHRKMIKIVAERVRQTGGSLIGVVLNRIPLGQSGYYGGYHNYSPYYFSHYGYQDGNHKGKNGTKVGKGKDKKEILKEFAVFKVISRKDS
jgi:succinoglycan biosynthesis transport protein ExoP